MPDRLAVWLHDRRVGTLIRETKGFRFEAMDGAAGLTVCPLGVESPWSRSFSRDWFDGLLPEEDQRTAAERNHRVERGDVFGLLAEIGWECAGAVSVLPEDRTPASGSYLPLHIAAIWERLDALPNLVDQRDESVRLSLGGAQEKLLLAWIGDGWALPLDGALSTHILKPEPPRYPGLAIAEAWALAAASSATIAARAELMVASGHRPTLVVSRYDRETVNGQIARTHQEDMCQALGLSPSRKYATSTKPIDPQLVQLARVLVNRAADPATELRRLLEQVTINTAIGNADAHAKNYSIVHRRSAVMLSPLYDVSPTMAFVPTQRQASLFVGGKLRIEEITRGHLLREARSWGIPEAIARDTIEGTLSRLGEGLETANERVPGLPAAIAARVRTQFMRLSGSSW